MFERKTLIKKNAGIELFKVESPNYYYFLILNKGKRYLRYSQVKAEELFNFLVSSAS